MPLTVSGVHAEITNALGGKMALADMPTAAGESGLVPGLSGPARDALSYVGVIPADPLAVSDADLSRIAPGRVKTYLDAAKLETLYVIQGRLTDAFDQQVEQDRKNLHQIAEDVAAMIAMYAARVPRLNQGRGAVGCAPPARIPNDPFRPPVSWSGFPYPRGAR